jgi:hypothetical protein
MLRFMSAHRATLPAQRLPLICRLASVCGHSFEVTAVEKYGIEAWQLIFEITEVTR